MPDKKYLDSDGLLYFYSGLKGKFVSDVTYNTTTHKFEKTKNGSTTEIVTAANLKTEMGLDNVGNFKAVSTVASQGLTEQEKANARANIGAGSSAFSGSFNDLTDVPTTISGYGITDAYISNGTITLGANSVSISGVYRYKGSVATYSALPATAEVGDVYNVESDGKNYAYTGVSGALWDDLGGSFTIVSITNSEIDTILAS